jgi:creatinine amidohydrolase
MVREKVRWEEMFPDELQSAQAEYPLIYMPLGLCEPHGPHCAIGLDAVKAHEICLHAARAHGGIVAPPFYWHIHETGYHAPWGEEMLGDLNTFMTSLPPWIMLRVFLYQLRAMAVRGFHAVIVVTGHYGGNEHDLRLVASVFSRYCPMRVSAWSDKELIDHPTYHGDHAGATETSQLWYLRPDLVDISRLTPETVENHYYAVGADAPISSRKLGEEIVRSQIERLGIVGRELLEAYVKPAEQTFLSFDETEAIWREIEARREEWVTLKIWDNQKPVNNESSWYINQFPHFPRGA